MKVTNFDSLFYYFSKPAAKIKKFKAAVFGTASRLTNYGSPDFAFYKTGKLERSFAQMFNATHCINFHNKEEIHIF